MFASMYESPIGTLGLACTERGLSSLMLRVTREAYFKYLETNFNVRLVVDDRPLTSTRLFLDRYFSGKRIEFNGPFDLLTGTPFQRAVWATLMTIPYGEVRSYRWLAGTMGHPGASRAVGAANGQNPVAILIPCHRVIHHNGGLGGYSGGIDIKRRLLGLERVPLAALAPVLPGFEPAAHP